MSNQHPRGSFSSAGPADNEVDSEDDVVDTKSGKGKDGEKADRKGIINRVNRACNNCRRMKMRCVGAEDPPCKRCRNAGLECVMEKPGRAANDGAGEDRIRSLEGQVSAMQSTLTDLVSTLRAGMSQNANASTSAAANQTPTINPSPDQFMSQPNSNGQYSNQVPQLSPSHSNPFDPNQFNFPLQNQMFPGTVSHRSPSYSAFPPGAVNFGFPPRQDVVRFDGSDASSVNSRNQPSPYQLMLAGGEATRPSPQEPPPLESVFRRPALPASNFPPPVQTATQPVEVSLPPSRAGSVGAEDILGPEHITNPLGAMSNMAGLVEAAEERARMEGGEPSVSKDPGGKRKGEDEKGTKGGPSVKKTRFSPTEPSGPTVVEAQHLPWKAGPSAKGKGKGKRKHIHAYPDAIAEGLVTEEEGREMMALFYAGSSNFVPCYDPLVDTWDALRLRSPFSITAIIMVGARVRDGGGPISDIQRLCRQHAQRIGVGTLFNPVARIEAVQAMILLAAFCENGWLPGGHAVRMAVDMGINRSFVTLLRSGMGKGKSPEELEEERHLVVQSRVWFCLYLVEHQMAYGMGRPAILREDESIHQCRRLLEHPLSIMSDARLVSTVELTALRAPLHIELTASPDLPIAEHTLRRLKQANADFDAWERYWDRVLSERFGKNRGDFFRESLIIQRQYAELFVNSQLLRGIRESSDVTSMPEEKRALAIRAMRNAQRCLEICLRGENYRNGLRYAVHYTRMADTWSVDVCAAFAASFLIRIARLFPNELNLKKTAKDVEELASILSEVPAGRYARSLRLIIRRARRAKVIPAASAISSPNKLSAPLPMMPDGSQPPAFSPSQLVNPAYHTTPVQNHNPASLSPNSMLFNATQQIMNDSPTSGTDLFEFDQLFAQETLERAGLSMGEGNQLPLFLDGQSLGASQAPTEMTPFVGIESFFLPAEVDFRLGGPTGSGENSGQAGGNENPLGGDVWW